MAGLGGVLGGAGTALEAHKRRLGRSLDRLRAVLGALEAMLQPSGGQKAPKMGAQEGLKSSRFWHRFRDRFLVRFGHPKIMKNHIGASARINISQNRRYHFFVNFGVDFGVKNGCQMGFKSHHRR